MSYIRSGSNPEKLYIWGDSENAVIAEGNKAMWDIPVNIFNSLIRKFHRRFHEYPCQYKDAQVEEVWVYDGDIEVIDDGTDPILRRSECKVKLSYNGHSVIMWDVTWEYIVYSNIERLK
jgi:hypothetical protein